MPTLIITRQAMAQIMDATRAADGNEQMGLIASRKGFDAITDAAILPSIAAASHAEASPTAIKECAETFFSRQLVPRGIWHSHGHLGVFHSGIDHDTMYRLLPAMAPWNFIRPQPPVLAPSVTGPDSAILPLLDSQTMKFHLTGVNIPGAEATERVEWVSITHKFADDVGEPHAMLEPHCLKLSGGTVVVSLGLPEGASLDCCTEDSAPFRVATLYSLVVNGRGASCAECMVIHDIEGFSFVDRKPCTIEVTDSDHGPL